MNSLKNITISFTVAGVLFFNPLSVQAEFGDQILKNGMEHEDIKILQQHLVDLNYLELEETTTYYGDQTTKAVMDFQSSQGLDVDGSFGPTSFKSLQNLLNIKPLVYTRTLKDDVSGEDVKDLQEVLKFLGFLSLENCTDYFGSETGQALMNFQEIHDLEADGIAGPETIETINNTLNGNSRKPKLSSANRGGSRNESLGENIVSTAEKYLGTPYSYGTSSSTSFDCSGYTYYIYKQYGIDIPRSSADQATIGAEISKENLQTGDLVIFRDTYKSGPSHAGIYIGNGNFIHASSAGGEVMVSDLSSGYYSNHFAFGRRLF